MQAKGQLSIEFIMMLTVSFALLFTFAYVMQQLSVQKNEEKTLSEVTDLGIALQNELLLASELEDGYMRTVYIPDTLNGLQYTIITGNASTGNGYIEITFQGIGLGYNIPAINGSLQKGYNTIMKTDGWLVVE